MIGTVDTTKDKQSSVTYSPDVLEFVKGVKQDYAVGDTILNKSWVEFNNRSVIDDMNNGRMMFNAFVDEGVENRDDDWRWRGTRSIARNKAIGMHANLTAAYLLPSFRAQNSEQEDDKSFSDFMTDLVEWMAEDQNSDYKENFLALVFAMETDPIVYLGAEYLEVMQTIRVKQEDGTYTKKEVLDEVLSGFKAPIYTASQVLLSNAFDRNLQRHKFNGRRRWIEYDEAWARYGDHENWDAVKMGCTVVYNAEDGLFYEVKDDDHPNMVEEFTSSYRRDDTEVCFIGGVYMGNASVDDNPMRHRDNFGAPRYNIQQFGFYPIGSHFIFYKSMMAALKWDNALYDAMTEIGMNRAMLEADFPVAISGIDKVDGEIIYPNAVVALGNNDAKVQKLLPDSNLPVLFQAMEMTKDSMSDATLNETSMGQLPPAEQKAYTVAQAQANAKKIIGGVAKGLALSVSKYGLLMGDIAVNNLSAPQADEISGMSYRKFTLSDKNVNGRRVSKQLVLDPELVGTDMTEEMSDEYSLKALEKVGYPDNDKHIYAVNPQQFAKMRYLAVADYREAFPQEDGALFLDLQNLWAILNNDPMIEREALLRELMYAKFRGKGDRFIAKQPMMGMQGLQAQGPEAKPAIPMLSTPTAPKVQ